MVKLSKGLKQIIKDFFEKMYNTTETGEELEDKIQRENQSFIQKIINFFMNKFNFLNKNSNKK